MRLQDHCLHLGATHLMAPEPGADPWRTIFGRGSRRSAGLDAARPTLMAGYAKICCLFLALAPALGACASGGSALPDVVDPPALRQVMTERGLDPDEIPIPHELDDEMKQWLELRVRLP